MSAIADTVALVTGANRGLGQQLVAALLERGASKVYAAARSIGSLGELDPRVVPLAIDLTDAGQIQQAARVATDVRLLINNASTAAFALPLEAEPEALAQEMATNYLGTLAMIRSFAPVIEAAGGGEIVNVLSVLSLAATPPMAGYSASKAAAHSMTQSLRPGLAARGIVIKGAYPAGIDTEMVAGFDSPKASPVAVAHGILDGVEATAPEIFPCTASQGLSELWWHDPKAFELAFSGG
jgi:NAD(P)-dependent dehydrogenase (short-subunit alcohol dehydrogenase family)